MLASALIAGSGRAEINLEESVELLTAKADRIVVGTIRKSQYAGADAPGKNRDLGLHIIAVKETLKGEAKSLLCLGTRDVNPEQLAAYAKQGTELLLFLERTEQATSFDGQVCNAWPLRNRGSSAPYVVPLADPGKRLLSATSFKVLRGREPALTAVRETVRRLAAGPQRPGQPSRQLMLEVPYESEVFNVLYSGSSCYLYVPEALFPKAKASLF